jgi:N-methylhydantoinase A
MTDSNALVVGLDIGGTCTDCVVVDGAGRVTLGKAFSTPPDFSAGIFDAVGVAAAELGRTTGELLADASLFLHSTTVAENAVVDGTLAQAGIVTNRGFEDNLLATRGGYGRWSGLTEEEKRNPIEQDKLPPIVDRGLIEGIRERTDAWGRRHVEADPAEIEAAVARLLEAGVEAIGVCLLWSFANPAAELAVADAVRRLRPDVFLTLSHDVAPVVGEYERTSTVALNARLGPVIGHYLESLARGLAEQGFAGTLLVAQAYGGVLPLEEAARRPVGMIESGPAAGLVGSKRLGELIGAPDVIAADMGGTTFKVGVIRQGLIEYQRESMVLRYHYALPKLDVVSLGLAGGSIVALDRRTATPRIGPRSAGSYPGPVCYGHGGQEPTITDVDAILGYLNPEFFLGGRERLDVDAAYEAVEQHVARPLRMDVVEAAAAMYRLANSRFTDLLHRTTVQRGLDPRRFALFSFGGTAGMHVCAYGAALGVARIVVPHSASVHGAFGLVGSDVTHEDQTTHLLREPFDAVAARQVFSSLEERVTAQLAATGFEAAGTRLERSVDMRYRRQVHVVTAPLGIGPVNEELLDEATARFEALYRERYGPEAAYREAGIELVTFRVRGSGVVRKPELAELPLENPDATGARLGTVRAWVDETGRREDVPGFSFELLRPGNRLVGPALVWTPITTVVVAPGYEAQMDSYRNLVLERPGEG